MSIPRPGHARAAVAACLLALALGATARASAQPVPRRGAAAVMRADSGAPLPRYALRPVGTSPVAPAPVKHRSPLLAGMLSMLVPGLGQAYAGEPWRGLAVFAVAEGCLVTAIEADNHTVSGVAGTVGFASYVFGILDATDAAQRYNERHARPPVRTVVTQ